MSDNVHRQKSDPRVGLRSDRIFDQRTLETMKEQVQEMCEKTGQRQAALLLGWPVSKLNHIYHGNWKDIAVYPEMKVAISVAHDIVMRHRKMSDEAKELSEQVAKLSADFASASAKLRRALKRL